MPRCWRKGSLRMCFNWALITFIWCSYRLTVLQYEASGQQSTFFPTADIIEVQVQVEDGRVTTVIPSTTTQVTTEATQPAVNRIILFSGYRTGSSFVGDVIKTNSDNDTFYMFEPFMFLHFNSFHNKAVHAHLAGESAVAYTTDLLNCNIENIMNASRSLFPQQAYVKKRTEWIYRCFVSAPSTNVSYMEEQCRMRKNIIIKSIRLKYLEDLIPKVFENDMKILFLIRDPRATLNSRWKIKGQKVLKTELIWNAAKHHCDSLTRNLEFILNNTKQLSINKRNFVIVRYEDLAMNPFGTTASLYSRLGIELTNITTRFLENHTHIRKVAGKAAQVGRSKYGLDRESSIAASSWRLSLDINKTLLIQKHCGRVLDWMGYGMVNSTEELKSLSNLLLNEPVNEVAQFTVF